MSEPDHPQRGGLSSVQQWRQRETPPVQEPPERMEAPIGSPRSTSATFERPGDAIDFKAFFRALWRRKVLFGLVAALSVSVVAAVIANMTPRYVAHALVAIGDPLAKSRLPYGANQAGMVAPPANLPDSGTVQTEVEVLKSPQLALQVIRDLKLVGDPEFDPAARPAKLAFIADIKRFLGMPTEAALANPSVELSRTIEGFLGQLRVSVKENSRMLDISFESMRPELAMKIANSLVDHYVDSQLEVRTQSAQRTSAWLRDKIGQLQAKVEEAEKAVERFRSQAGLFSTPGGSPLLLKQMTDVSAELASAQLARTALEARLAHLRSAAEGKGVVGSMAGIATTPLMKTLDDQQADAQQKLAEASALVGEKHPTALGLREKLRRIQVARRSEELRSIATVESDLKVANMKEHDIAERLASLQGEVAEMNRSEITLRALERDAQADRLVLNNFISRFKEASQESDVSSQRPDARVVSYAQLPPNPDRPKKGLLMLIACVASLIGSAALVHVVEKSNQRVIDAEEIERHLGASALGILPTSKAAGLAPSEAARYGFRYREELKAIYSRLFWTHRPPKITLVTSALPNEGKTTLALGLAAIAAQSGQRVIVVDGDFWKMGASLKLGVPTEAGLAGLLEGKGTLSKVIVADTASGCDILPPGHFSRASLVAWIGKLPAILDALTKQYDIIVIDAPPLLSVAEARLLVAFADATVLAIRSGGTSRDFAKAALLQLKQAGASLAGCVLTMAPASNGSRYSYDPPYYYPGNSSHSRSAATSGQVNRRSGEHRYLRDDTRSAAVRTRSWLRKRLGKYQAVAPLALPSGHVHDDGKPTGSASRHAVLVMDMADIFDQSTGRKSSSARTLDALIQTVNRITRSAGMAGMLIVYAQGGDRTIRRRMSRRRQSSDRPGARLKPVAGYGLLKPAADAFSNPELDDFLCKRGVDHLILIGLDGATSIAKTARSALDLGYKVTFVRDGIFTASEAKWGRLLSGFEERAAFAISSEEFDDLRWRLAKRPDLTA